MRSGPNSLKKRLIRGAGVVTAAAVLLPTLSLAGGADASAAATQGSAEKSESVYANLSSAGKTEQIVVSDWLHDDTGGAAIVDRSQLSDITNVKGNEKPQIDGDTVTWKLSGNDLYYEGKTDKQLPVSMTLRYYLNGSGISPAELAGKSGHFELKISFQNNDAHDMLLNGRTKTVYTPFACMAALDLPAQNFKNVTTNFGSVISDGKNQAVSFLSFPGLKQSFDMIDFSSANLPDELDVKADATDFSLGPVMMAAAPVPDLDSIKNTGDLGSLADRLQQLVDAGSQLKTATGKLNAGETAFADGVSQLSSGIATAGSSFDRIYGGAVQLSAASGDAQKGIPALTGGARSIAGGAGQLSSGLDALFAQFGKGTAQSPTLKDSVGSLNSGAQQLSGGLGRLFAQFSPSANGQPATLYDSIGALNSGTAQFTALSSTTLFGMTEANLSTLRGALTSALTPALKQQGMTQQQISAAVQAALQTAVSQELTGLHGAADAAVLEYLTAESSQAKSEFSGLAAEYINLYDVLSVIASDPAVAGAADQAAAEAAFEREMKSAAAAPSAYLYRFDKSALPVTLAAQALTAQQQAALISAANVLPDAQIAAFVTAVNASNLVLAGAGVSAGATALAEQFKTAVSGQSATLYDSVKALAAGADQLKGGTALLAAQTVTSGDPSHPSLYDSIGALDSGSKTLKSGALTFASGVSGLSSLNDGIASLTNALGLFRGGLVSIQSGAGKLNGGAVQLKSGASALDSGMSQFWSKGLSKLQDVHTDKLNDALAVKDEMIKLADAYTSFSGSGEGISSSVKFILKTDEIKAPQTAAAPASGTASAKHESFWQKVGDFFRNLFRSRS